MGAISAQMYAQLAQNPVTTCIRNTKPSILRIPPTIASPSPPSLSEDIDAKNSNAPGIIKINGHTYAQGSEMIFDEARLWKYFSEDSSLPNRATIMAMNTNLDATVYNKEGQSHKIIDAAKKLLKKLKD